MGSTGQTYGNMQWLASERLEALGFAQPPINVYAALRREGVLVEPWPFSNFALAGCYMDEAPMPPSVAINSRHAPKKKRFTAAHEYKHHLADRTSGELLCYESSESRTTVVEKAANAFAARFLMPEVMVRDAVKQLGNNSCIHALAELFGVNYPTVVYRLHNLRLITAKVRDDLLSSTGRQRERSIYESMRARSVNLNLAPKFVFLQLTLLGTVSGAPWCTHCRAIKLEDSDPCYACGC